MSSKLQKLEQLRGNIKLIMEEPREVAVDRSLPLQGLFFHQKELNSSKVLKECGP